MKYDYGLTGVGFIEQAGLIILANTPGIPLEWLYAACWVPRSRRAWVREYVGSEPWIDLGLSNAATVQEGDGLKLLWAARPQTYSGPIPLWSQLELEADPRPDHVIAAEFGVNRLKVWRWRTNQVFDPLTGRRLVASRGGKLR